MDIIDKLDNIIEAKKKKKWSKIKTDDPAIQQKKVSRIPNAPPTQFHKDKSKYKRNPKHKKSFLD